MCTIRAQKFKDIKGSAHPTVHLPKLSVTVIQELPAIKYTLHPPPNHQGLYSFFVAQIVLQVK